MKVANKTLLDDFVQSHPTAIAPLNQWLNKLNSLHWHSHTDIKQTFPKADYVKNGRYVFNIGGNRFRVVAIVLFIDDVIFIRFIGTHSEYNKIDCTTI